MIIKTPSCTFTIPFLDKQVVPEIEEVEYENGNENAEAFSEWVRQHEELELLNFEMNY